MSNATMREYLGIIQSMTREEFIKRYPHPFLVSESSSASQPGAAPGKAFKTMVGNIQGEMPIFDEKEQRVLPMTKSDRNKFKNMITVGRADNNDIILEDLSVSKFHAYFNIDSRKQEYSVCDAESRYGTFVEGRKLAPSAPRILDSGHSISFGMKTKLTFYKCEDFYNYVKILRGLGKI